MTPNNSSRPSPTPWSKTPATTATRPLPPTPRIITEHMKKILIVEDDQKIAFALCVRLKAHGYATWIAGDAITATNLAVRYKPDLILMDLSLPAGHGLTLAEQFHQLPETRATPVILATASKDPELRNKAIELGAVGLLRKPYEAEALLTVVKHALRDGDGISARTFAAPPNHALQKHKHKRILIVEDDQKVARALAVRMNAAGFETTVANDALSGVRSAVTDQPDAVVLDISLPANARTSGKGPMTWARLGFSRSLTKPKRSWLRSGMRWRS